MDDKERIPYRKYRVKLCSDWLGFLIQESQESNADFGVPYCMFSAKELYEACDKMLQSIRLVGWSLDEINLSDFLKYFKNIIFRTCSFKRIEREKKNQKLTSSGNKMQTEIIIIEGIHYENVINLFELISLLEDANLKRLEFVGIHYNQIKNDLWITVIKNVPVEFVVDEIVIYFNGEKEEIIFGLVIVEKLIKNIQRCSLVFHNGFQLDILIRADDERLKVIDAQLGDNFLIIDG